MKALAWLFIGLVVSALIIGPIITLKRDCWLFFGPFFGALLLSAGVTWAIYTVLE